MHEALESALESVLKSQEAMILTSSPSLISTLVSLTNVLISPIGKTQRSEIQQLHWPWDGTSPFYSMIRDSVVQVTKGINIEVGRCPFMLQWHPLANNKTYDLQHYWQLISEAVNI